MHVAIAADRRYLPWSATLIRSCLRQHPDGITIHLLQEGAIPAADLRRLSDMVELAGSNLHAPALDASPLQRVQPDSRFGGRTALLRLLLPRVLPDIPRVIYLDVDTLVVRPLDGLWGTDLDGMPIAAVANVVEPAMHGHLVSLGITDPRECFNSGVLVIDLDLVREESSFDETIDVLASLNYAPWFDQDALNVVFANRWRALHPRWNAMNSLWVWSDWASTVFGDEAVRDATASPSILHFEGPAIAKPLHFLCSHPWRDYYRSVKGETPWADAPLEEKNAVTRLIGRLPSNWRLPAYARFFRAKRVLKSRRSRVQRRA